MMLSTYRSRVQEAEKALIRIGMTREALGRILEKKTSAEQIKEELDCWFAELATLEEKEKQALAEAMEAGKCNSNP